jgi:hypothetical protein
LSRKQALAATSHIAKLPAQSANQAPISLASGSLVCEFVDQVSALTRILDQQWRWAPRFRDPPPANDVERRTPGSCASRRLSAPTSKILGKQTAFRPRSSASTGLQQQLLGSSASTRPSAPTSRILGQQTIYCNTAPTSRSSASKRPSPSALTSRILRQRHRQANPSAPTSRILGKQTTARIQRTLVLQTSRLPGSSASKKPRAPRLLAPISRIPCQRTIFSANLQVPLQTNSLQRPDPRPANGHQLQLLRSSASTRPSAPTSRIFGQQTTYSAHFEILGKQTTVSADPQDPPPANDKPNPRTAKAPANDP